MVLSSSSLDEQLGLRDRFTTASWKGLSPTTTRRPVATRRTTTTKIAAANGIGQQDDEEIQSLITNEGDKNNHDSDDDNDHHHHYDHNKDSILRRMGRKMGIPIGMVSIVQSEMFRNPLQWFQPRWQRWVNFFSIIVFISDPPFLIYGIIINLWLYQLCRKCCFYCHESTTTSPQQAMKRFAPIGMVIMIIFAILTQTSEVNRKRIYSYDLTNLTMASTEEEEEEGSSSLELFNHSFYRMIPVDDSYSQKLLHGMNVISDYMQETSTTPDSSSPSLSSNHPIVNVPVSNVKLFDNAIRFDFLYEFRNNPKFTADFGCLIETDVVVDTSYVAFFMTKSKVFHTSLSNTSTTTTTTTNTTNTNNTTQHDRRLKKRQNKKKNNKKNDFQQRADFLHIQHMWGHYDFEEQNYGLLCVRNKHNTKLQSNEKNVQQEKTKKSLIQRFGNLFGNSDGDTYYLDWWLRVMSYLNNRRYCRLLPKTLLFWMAPNRIVLYWDKHHGCTLLYPHCKYIHFTRPKGEGIQKALRTIQAAQKEQEREKQLQQKLLRLQQQENLQRLQQQQVLLPGLKTTSNQTNQNNE